MTQFKILLNYMFKLTLYCLLGVIAGNLLVDGRDGGVLGGVLVGPIYGMYTTNPLPWLPMTNT